MAQYTEGTESQRPSLVGVDSSTASPAAMKIFLPAQPRPASLNIGPDAVASPRPLDIAPPKESTNAAIRRWVWNTVAKPDKLTWWGERVAMVAEKAEK